MESFPTISQRLSAIPRLVWFVSLVVVVSAVAIFMFNFAVGTVASYALFALFCGSHFFMHGPHGTEHKDREPSNPSLQDQAEKAPSPRAAQDRRTVGDLYEGSRPAHADHSKGCH
jgi:hypothetical protein